MNSFLINHADAESSINKSKEDLKNILSKYSLTPSKELKTLLDLVEEAAIECTMQYLWSYGYWVLREQQRRGPIDLYAYKIVNGQKIEYFIDVKGIRPNAKQSPPRYKPTLPKDYQRMSYQIRDRIVNRIVAIVFLKDKKTRRNIIFTEGWHTFFGGKKDLEGKRIIINKIVT
tara:strand:+ start:914 stop:1432 length:519 start_codon:yes stop_codon:yes gene_type:complete